MKKLLQGTTVTGLLVAIATIVMPFAVAPHLFYGGTNAKYFLVLALTYAVCLVFAIKLLIKPSLQVVIKDRWLLLLIFLTFIVHVVAGLNGLDPAQSFWADIIRSSGVFFLAHIGLLALILAELLSKQDWVLVRRGFILSSLVYSILYFFSGAGTGLLAEIAIFKKGGATFGNDTFAGMYILFSVMFTLIEISKAKKWSKSFWLWGAVLLPQMLSPLLFNFDVFAGRIRLGEIFEKPTILFGDARASSATVALVVLFLIGRHIINLATKKVGKGKLLKLIYSWLWGIAVLASVFMLFMPSSFIYNKYVDESSGARPIIWQEGWQGIKERPLLGWGPENFEFVNYRYFDNDLFLGKNKQEVWFDRAHNIFIDSLVGIGAIGLLVLLTILVYLIKTFSRAASLGKISKGEATLLSLLLLAHIMQMQTSFEVISTYFVWALILGYGMWLEKACVLEDNSKHVVTIKKPASSLLAGVIIVGVIFGSSYFFFGELARQRALTGIFTTANQELRLTLIKKALSRPGSLEALRRSSGSMIESVIANAKTAFGSSENIKNIKEQIKIYDEHYREYLEKVPTDYRASISHAYLSLFSIGLGEKSSEDVRAITTKAKKLSPENPLTSIIESLSYVYEGNFSEADRAIKEATELNPEIEITQKVMDYIDKQEEIYPNFTFLQLGNL